MLKQYGTAELKDFGFWDRVKIFFSETYTEDYAHGWAWRNYKVYKGRKIIIGEGRYK